MTNRPHMIATFKHADGTIEAVDVTLENGRLPAWWEVNVYLSPTTFDFASEPEGYPDVEIVRRAFDRVDYIRAGEVHSEYHERKPRKGLDTTPSIRHPSNPSDGAT